jgi:cbb3-type cytochrome oxidase subunit 3
MIQNVLHHLGGIQHYGIISLCLFLAIFGAAMVWAFAQRKAHLDRMARLPLEDDDQTQ